MDSQLKTNVKKLKCDEFEKTICHYISGKHDTLTLSATNTLTIDGTDKALTVKNLRLYLTNATAMQCTNDTSKIILQDSEVHMTHLGATFAKGHLDIKNNVSILGADETSSASSTFTFSSKGLLTVLTDSIMRLEKGTLFDYAPNISGDGGNAAVSKRHLLLSNPSSTLWLDSCTVSTSSAGFALDYGRLLVDGKTTFHINATNGAEMEIGSALLVELAPGGVLDIDGALKYTETTYL